MKKYSTELFSSLSREEVANLTREVNETWAADVVKNETKRLSVADLWHIQRSAKPRPQRRYF
ncbi:MAG: hypothetical protein IPL84_02740 [Chitinophagaceae bacterium]|nr:hypothetical protein [Chitinophagaceae bacterium]